jgi:alpha-L-rhamnosidase
MGLLSTGDWTGEWLAVEDDVARADREFGLHWIWGTPSTDRSVQRFRFKFDLTDRVQSGELVVVLNDWNVLAQLSRVWIDGVPVAGRGQWTEDIGPETGWLSREYLQLPTLNPGHHVIAVEVSTAEVPPDFIESGYVHALSLFVRARLDSGETRRLGSGPHCKTQAAREADGLWYKLGFDDAGWDTARAVDIGGYQPWPPQPAMHLRRAFSLDQPVISARLYTTALGAYEARLNGQRVGDALLTPEISQYAKRVLYRVHDVTALVRPGDNSLGLVVGDGWYASFDGRFAWTLPPRRVLAQLELTLADGSRQITATGPGWRIAESPIRLSEIRAGEIYDARLERVGWDTAPFDDAHWQEAQLAERPACRLVAQVSSPIRATQTLAPRTITQIKRGVYLFDFGQTFAGWCRLNVKGPAGTRIELRFAELLMSSGEADIGYTRGNMGEPKCDVYILRGDDAGESFEPHFTYRGFRYVQVIGLPTPPTPKTLEGVVVHSDLEITGQLKVDSPLIERIWQATLWTQRSNFVGIPTDCPSREQRGWLGDPGIYWDAAAFNMNVAAFTARHMDDVVDEQAADGSFPTIAPEPHNNNALFFHRGSTPAWADAGIILPWITWRHYGDTDLIERHWQAMDRYLNSILVHNPDYLWRNQRGLDVGDHLELSRISPAGTAPATPNELLATAYWAHSANLLAQMSQAIGRPHDAHRLQTLFEHIRQAFNAGFVKPDGTVGTGSQTSYVLALRFGLLPEHLRRVAAERLAADIRQRGISLTTGIVGTQFILDVLAETGYTDLAYGLLLRTEYPSWGYMIAQGATTIWESWSGKLSSEKDAAEWSHNHFALGAVSGFLFRRIAGIEAATPGFESITIRPALDPRVKRGGADYHSVRGWISTRWQQRADGFSLNVSIPANTSARVILPAHPSARVHEGLRGIANRKDLSIIHRSDREVTLEMGSGSYEFLVSRA